jgi:hypothetical protein
MRIIAMLAASAHIGLAACQAGPTAGSLLDANPNQPQQQPYMRCMNDFWGNCTAVVSSRTEYKWRYVRPGVRSPEEEPAGRRQAEAAAKVPGANDHVTKVRVGDPAMRVRQPEPAPPKAREVVQPVPKVREATQPPSKVREVAQPAPKVREAILPAPKVRETRDNTIVCHPRRRVVGEERPSRDDAQRAAENAWMGNVRYDFGERYQDINRAKDVRNICGPSSVSHALRVPQFRCVLEATPCRATEGEPIEPDERRYDPTIEMSSSRKGPTP